MNWNYDCAEIAQILCESTYDDCNQWDDRYLKAKECLEWLRDATENPYNADCFKGFYQLLQDYANAHEGYLK